jgi:hypothetical protein
LFPLRDNSRPLCYKAASLQHAKEACAAQIAVGLVDYVDGGFRQTELYRRTSHEQRKALVEAYKRANAA